MPLKTTKRGQRISRIDFAGAEKQRTWNGQISPIIEIYGEKKDTPRLNSQAFSPVFRSPILALEMWCKRMPVVIAQFSDTKYDTPGPVCKMKLNCVLCSGIRGARSVHNIPAPPSQNGIHRPNDRKLYFSIKDPPKAEALNGS